MSSWAWPWSLLLAVVPAGEREAVDQAPASGSGGAESSAARGGGHRCNVDRILPAEARPGAAREERSDDRAETGWAEDGGRVRAGTPIGCKSLFRFSAFGLPGFPFSGFPGFRFPCSSPRVSGVFLETVPAFLAFPDFRVSGDFHASRASRSSSEVLAIGAFGVGGSPRLGILPAPALHTHRVRQPGQLTPTHCDSSWPAIEVTPPHCGLSDRHIQREWKMRLSEGWPGRPGAGHSREEGRSGKGKMNPGGQAKKNPRSGNSLGLQRGASS